MAKVDYGAVALIPVGEYSASRQYHANELVGYQGSSYVALQNPPVGTLPTNTTYFMLHTEGTSIATASTPGTVKPDGTSTVVDASGAMSVKPSIVETIQNTAELADESAAKIGNVPTGKTLQSQLNAAAQSIAQNTTNIAQIKTDIAANAAGIAALNTGLAKKIESFTDTASVAVTDIVWNMQESAFKARIASDGNWAFLSHPVKYYQGTWLTPSVQNLVVDSVALFGWGRLRTLCINFHFTQQTNLADGTQLFSVLSTAPVGSFFALARNGSSQMAQLALSGNKTINLWGAMQSVATAMWSVQFTYFTV